MEVISTSIPWDLYSEALRCKPRATRRAALSLDLERVERWCKWETLCGVYSNSGTGFPPTSNDCANHSFYFANSGCFRRGRCLLIGHWLILRVSDTVAVFQFGTVVSLNNIKGMEGWVSICWDPVGTVVFLLQWRVPLFKNKCFWGCIVHKRL
jgi:hypothetical protein